WKNTGYCFPTDGKRLMTKKGSLDFLLLIYYIESRRRLLLAEAFRVQIRHYNQLRTNILHKDEGFERKNA
ncbi:hypothetical protein, partial [Phocaeicola vulgatus]